MEEYRLNNSAFRTFIGKHRLESYKYEYNNMFIPFHHLSTQQPNSPKHQSTRGVMNLPPPVSPPQPTPASHITNFPKLFHPLPPILSNLPPPRSSSLLHELYHVPSLATAASTTIPCRLVIPHQQTLAFPSSVSVDTPPPLVPIHCHDSVDSARSWTPDGEA